MISGRFFTLCSPLLKPWLFWTCAMAIPQYNYKVPRYFWCFLLLWLLDNVKNSLLKMFDFVNELQQMKDSLKSNYSFYLLIHFLAQDSFSCEESVKITAWKSCCLCFLSVSSVRSENMELLWSHCCVHTHSTYNGYGFVFLNNCFPISTL